jgi:hypothetical protein
LQAQQIRYEQANADAGANAEVSARKIDLQKSPRKGVAFKEELKK